MASHSTSPRPARPRPSGWRPGASRAHGHRRGQIAAGHLLRPVHDDLRGDDRRRAGRRWTSSNDVIVSYGQFGTLDQHPPGSTTANHRERLGGQRQHGDSELRCPVDGLDRDGALAVQRGGDPADLTPNSTTTFDPLYYDQLAETLQAATAAGGQAMTASNDVTASYTSFNSSATQTVYDGVTPTAWVDNTTTVNFDTASSGSTASERWQYDAAGVQPSFTTEHLDHPRASYYDQVSDTFSATTATGGTPMTSSNDIVADYNNFGNLLSLTVYDGSPATAWVDYAATPTVSFNATSSGSTATERWQSNAARTPVMFTPSSSTTFNPTYYDQYLLTVTGNPAAHDTPGSTGTAFGASVPNGGTSAFYDAGSTANAMLTSGQVTEAGIGYTFTDWSGDASGTGLISGGIGMSAPMTATANWLFAPSFSSLSSPTITYGQTTTIVSGAISDGSATPFPSGQVAITIDGVTQNANI